MTPTGPTARVGDIRAAHSLIKDLFTPRPTRYWTDLILSGSFAWAIFLAAAIEPMPPAITVGFLVVAAALWYRAAALIHELTHQRRDEIPGFHLAWNLFIGVPWLLPSITYEGVHQAHHKKTTYGTDRDPEYLMLAGRPLAILGYLLQSVVYFPAALLRFLVGSPLSWVIPPLRRFLCRSASSYVINVGYERTMTPADRRQLFRWECVVLLVWGVPILLTLNGDLPCRWLTCWYVMYTIVLLVNRVRMLTAHRFASEGVPTDHLGQFRDSIDTPTGWWAELWAPIGMRYHALHHLFPTLPYHNLGIAYRRLAATLPRTSFYHESTGPGLVGSLAELVRGDTRASKGQRSESGGVCPG